jgi:hypothetical protein
VKRDKVERPKYSELQNFINHLSKDRPYNPNEDAQALEMRRFRDFMERRGEFVDSKSATRLNQYLQQLKNGGITDADQQKAFIEQLVKDGEPMESVALLVSLMKSGQLNKILTSDSAVIDYKKLAEDLKNLLISGFDTLSIDTSAEEDRRETDRIIQNNQKLRSILNEKMGPGDLLDIFNEKYLNAEDVKVALDEAKRLRLGVKIVKDFMDEKEALFIDYPRTFEILASEIGEENTKDLINQELLYLGLSTEAELSNEERKRILKILNNLNLTREQKAAAILKK